MKIILLGLIMIAFEWLRKDRIYEGKVVEVIGGKAKEVLDIRGQKKGLS